MTHVIDRKSLKHFALMACMAIGAIVLVSAFLLPNSFLTNSICGANKDSAKEALSLLKDWAIWMASIQTATIAALGLLAKDGLLVRTLTRWQARWAILVALFNTSALFFSAWLLTSLSSLMLRVYQPGLSNYDFYNRPLYAYMEGSILGKFLTVAFFAFWNHWLWALGIVSFGALCITLIVEQGET